jgi:glycosyltransferase involved in cell wall biosynthesis
MIIGFDAYQAFNDNNSIGKYARFVINNIPALYPSHQYRLYTPRATIRPDMEAIACRPNITVAEPSGTIDRLFSARWRRRSVADSLKADNVQIFHGLHNDIPLGLKRRGIRSVVTIHESSALRNTGPASPSAQAAFVRQTRRACLEADHIITLNDYTRTFLLSAFGIDHSRISVVRQGCDPVFASIASDEDKSRVRSKYHLPERFILNVGRIEARSNLVEAVKALALLGESIHLVAAGSLTPYVEKVKSAAQSHGVLPQLHILPNVAPGDLPAIYQSADAFVYLSTSGGFAEPVVEALYSGAAAALAEGTATREAGGEYSLYVNYDDENAVARAIRRIMVRPKMRKHMILQGKKHAARFETSLIAWQMMEIYNCIAEE